jgi:hypothetical protein
MVCGPIPASTRLIPASCRAEARCRAGCRGRAGGGRAGGLPPCLHLPHLRAGAPPFHHHLPALPLPRSLAKTPERAIACARAAGRRGVRLGAAAADGEPRGERALLRAGVRALRRPPPAPVAPRRPPAGPPPHCRPPASEWRPAPASISLRGVRRPRRGRRTALPPPRAGGQRTDCCQRPAGPGFSSRAQPPSPRLRTARLDAQDARAGGDPGPPARPGGSGPAKLRAEAGSAAARACNTALAVRPLVTRRRKLRSSAAK